MYQSDETPAAAAEVATTDDLIEIQAALLARQERHESHIASVLDTIRSDLAILVDRLEK